MVTAYIVLWFELVEVLVFSVVSVVVVYVLVVVTGEFVSLILGWYNLLFKNMFSTNPGYSATAATAAWSQRLPRPL